MDQMDICDQRSCYVCGHTPNSVSAKGLSFHSIPTNLTSGSIRNKWLAFLHLPPSGSWPRELWRDICLCSLHFKEEDNMPGHQDQDTVCTLLTDQAVPTQNQPAGPGAYGTLFPPMLPESSYSETLSVDAADCQPVPMEDTIEESPCTSTNRVHTSVKSPDTPLGGVISKFRVDSKFNSKKSMGLPNHKLLRPCSTCPYQVSRYFRKKHQRLTRQRLAITQSQALSEEQNQDVYLSDQLINSLQEYTKKPVNSRQYSNDFKALCLAFQGSSAQFYELLGQLLALPSPETLNRFRQSVPLTAGISKTVLNSMAKRLPSMSEIDKICVLMFDEMRLAKQLHYDPVDDHILGFQDVEGCRYPTFADHSLVFMVRGLVSEWKQPVAFHLGRAISQGNLDNSLRETVIALQGIGLKVVAIVSDLIQSNIAALRTLAMKTMPERDDPVLEIGYAKIVTFADTPHLLKVLRNNFLNYDVIFRGENGLLKTAKFDILKEFLEYEKQHLGHRLPSLTDRHLEPTAQKHLQVKYAAQLFSGRVATELSIFASMTGNNDARDLAEFIDTVINLFVSFNAFSAKRDTKLRLCVTENSFHHVFWTDMLHSLKEWKFVVRSPRSNPPRSKCFYFWQRNIIAAQTLWREVRGLGVGSLKTRNLNQDPLDCFFDSVRLQGDCYTNPSSRRFMDIFKISMLNSFAMKLRSKRGNVLQDQVSLFSDLLNSRSANRENNSLETHVSGVGHVSTSLASLCTVSKEVETCTRWVNAYSSNEITEGVLGCAANLLLLSFLRKHGNSHSISSCLNCFRSFYLCNHPEPSPGKATCDKCTTLNSSLASRVFEIRIFVLKELQKFGYKSQLCEKLKMCARDFPLYDLSCNEHGDKLRDAMLTFVIRTTIENFCLRVNCRLRALSRKIQPHS